MDKIKSDLSPPSLTPWESLVSEKTSQPEKQQLTVFPSVRELQFKHPLKMWT